MSAKVYYYQATGRANVIRLALAAANLPFEDVYPSGFPPTEEDKVAWRKLGGNTTTNVPMLEMADGKVYTQSQAVLRAIGRMGNLTPKDDDGLYVTDKLIEDAESLRMESYKCFITWGAPQANADAFIETILPLHLGNLERQLKESSGGYFLGDSLTLADVACYDAVVNFGSNRVPLALDAFPELKAWRGRVESGNEGIKKYLASDAYSGLMKFGPDSLGK
eukprot:CAMPEP_0201874906 /NCGR_PEP_ID=MMETSP0902-20130614/7024_1 /ASSEMBLY_ACC=CAM_ASM_000551 /TAXON_ID=420261 /ORGANISM="Thalassiosira antarctica, Strain CCMP982" /LENGTH=220 /DNA_ID=CAMNT_0048401851 /DNA_START=52 /DNA_END=714 /DNA_ORIENTATION=+